jgi:glutamate-1-semialdehyde 2,1-aminomutase
MMSDPSIPKTGFSISTYPDADALMTELRALTARPIRGLKPAALAAYVQQAEESCLASKAMTDEAAEHIPGGVQHNLAFSFPFPLVFTQALGNTLTDLDGNEYLDFLQAGGPTVLGSNPPAVREQVEELLRTTGPVTGLFHEFELKLARFITRRFPGVDMFRALGSGTEACMAAIRLARVATGRKRIIKLGGAYHGWSDQLSYGQRVPGTRGFLSHGIPGEAYKHTDEVYPGDLGALERCLQLNRLRGGTAALILEPVGPESGTRPIDRGYNAEARRLCDRYGALLIFDEVVTGFRLGMSGAQGYFGVTPDLTVFGKTVAGGYPSAGGLGGRRDLMALLAGGIGGKAIKKKVHVGGTMAANPLSSAAGYFTLVEMERANAPEVAGRAGDRLTAGLRALIQRYHLPFVAYNQGSICHLQTTGVLLLDLQLTRPWTIPGRLKEIGRRAQVMQEYGAAYMGEGLVTLAGSRMYTSAACDDAFIDDALLRFERVFKNVEGV